MSPPVAPVYVQLRVQMLMTDESASDVLEHRCGLFFACVYARQEIKKFLYQSSPLTGLPGFLKVLVRSSWRCSYAANCRPSPALLTSGGLSRSTETLLPSLRSPNLQFLEVTKDRSASPHDSERTV